jgi:hypothetical protein
LICDNSLFVPESEYGMRADIQAYAAPGASFFSQDKGGHIREVFHMILHSISLWAIRERQETTAAAR